MSKAKPARAEILKGIGWKPLRMKGVPAEVLEAENRRMQDYIVAWTQGLAAHLNKAEAAKAPARKRADRKPPRPGRKG